MTIEIIDMQATEQERDPLPFEKLVKGKGFRLTPSMGYEVKNVRSSCNYWSKKLNASISCKLEGDDIVVICHDVGTPIVGKKRGRPGKLKRKSDDLPEKPKYPWRPDPKILFAAWRADLAVTGLAETTENLNAWVQNMEAEGWPGFDGVPDEARIAGAGEAPQAQPGDNFETAQSDIETSLHGVSMENIDCHGNVWNFS